MQITDIYSDRSRTGQNALLHLVKQGSLKLDDPQAQPDEAFALVCQYGPNPVRKFPVHTKEAAALSAAYYADQHHTLDRGVQAVAGFFIKEALGRHGITPTGPLTGEFPEPLTRVVSMQTTDLVPEQSTVEPEDLIETVNHGWLTKQAGMTPAQKHHSATNAVLTILEIVKVAKERPSFTETKSPDPDINKAKRNEIYRALKRDNPDIPAGMKARIANRRANVNEAERKTGPPYDGPLHKEGSDEDAAKLASAFLGASDDQHEAIQRRLREDESQLERDTARPLPGDEIVDLSKEGAGKSNFPTGNAISGDGLEHLAKKNKREEAAEAKKEKAEGDHAGAKMEKRHAQAWDKVEQHAKQMKKKAETMIPQEMWDYAEKSIDQKKIALRVATRRSAANMSGNTVAGELAGILLGKLASTKMPAADIVRDIQRIDSELKEASIGLDDPYFTVFANGEAPKIAEVLCSQAEPTSPDVYRLNAVASSYGHVKETLGEDVAFQFFADPVGFYYKEANDEQREKIDKMCEWVAHEEELTDVKDEDSGASSTLPGGKKFKYKMTPSSLY